MTSRGVVYVDEDDGSYDKLRVPSNWTVHREPEWRSLQGSLQWCLSEYPDATSYGWLADDTFPRTRGWDKALETSAGDFNLAYANDLWYSDNGNERDQLERGLNISSGLCWGGELVRQVGWWALPGVVQAGIDTAWIDIVRPLGLHRYRHDIVVEHLNWRTEKRDRDETDSWDRPGLGDYVTRDIDTKNAWYRSEAYRTTLDRLASRVFGVSHDAALIARRGSLIDQLSTQNAMPAARLSRIQEGGRDDYLAHEAVFGAYANEGPAGLAPSVRQVGS